VSIFFRFTPRTMGDSHPDALKEIYSDLNQLRAMYSESAAASKAAWAEGASRTNPSVPTSARAAGISPLSARLSQRAPPAPGAPQSARSAAATNPYGFCMQMPASARGLLPGSRILEEVPLPSEAKAARQPGASKPLETPRSARIAPVAPAKPTPATPGAAGTPYIPPPGTVFDYDGGSSVVLPPHTEPPTDKEVAEYARWLGVDPEAERELTWLAREALTAPLPPYWRPCNTQDGELYYFNFATGDSLWDHPLDALFKRCVPLERTRLKTCRESGTPYEVPESYIHATIGAFLAHLCPAELQHSLMRERGTETAGDVTIPAPGTTFSYDDGGHSVVMEDNAEHYRPSEEEVREYAQWLGIDPSHEKELLWVATDGLTTPLPDPWRPCKTSAGDLYYFNFASGESAWEHPMDEFFKKLVVLERDKLQRCKEDNLPYTRGAS